MSETSEMSLAEQRLGSELEGDLALVRLLAVGGMGAVYEGLHRGERVAVKLMHDALLETPTVKERFLREGRIAQRLEHESVPRVHHVGTLSDGGVYLVMELFEGENLAYRLHRSVCLTPAQTLALAERMLDVLVVAHEHGILHRDIKPENVFLTRGGELKVLDFGIARLREQGAEALTQAGCVLGTPAFMAPEQARGEWADVDERTDVWAVGAVMFNTLTGRVPNPGPTPIDELVLAATQPAPKVGSVAASVPEPVAALVDRALAADRADRWPDARTMRDAIRDLWSSVSEGASLDEVRRALAADSQIVPAQDVRTSSWTLSKRREAEARAASAATSPEASPEDFDRATLGVAPALESLRLSAPVLAVMPRNSFDWSTPSASTQVMVDLAKLESREGFEKLRAHLEPRPGRGTRRRRRSGSSTTTASGEASIEQSGEMLRPSSDPPPREERRRSGKTPSAEGPRVLSDAKPVDKTPTSTAAPKPTDLPSTLPPARPARSLDTYAFAFLAVAVAVAIAVLWALAR